MKEIIRIPVTIVTQHGQTLFTGPFTKEISNSLNVCRDVFNPEDKSGYQRIIDEKRVGEIKSFVHEMKRLMPSAILINFRNSIKKIETVSPSHAYIVAEKGTPVYIYDGQHRESGSSTAWKEGLEDFNLVAVYTTLEPTEELYQFNVTNRMATGVNRTIVEQGIIQWRKDKSEECKILLPTKMRSDFAVLPESYQLAEYMNRDSDSPWKGLFTLPNSKPRKGSMDEGKVQKYFQCVIKNKDDLFPSTTEKRNTLIKNYGKAIRNFCPNSFETQNEYLLTRHVGMEFLGKLLLIIMMYFEKNKIKENNQKNFEMILDKLGKYMTDQFWHSKNGEARKYHGTVNVTLLSNECKKILEV